MSIKGQAPKTGRIIKEDDSTINLADIVADIYNSTDSVIQTSVETLTTPTLYHVALTNADTQYSQALPDKCKHFNVYIVDGISDNNFRLAYATGKVATPTAPYLKYPQNVVYESPENIKVTRLTVYIASSVGSKTAIIEAWT